VVSRRGSAAVEMKEKIGRERRRIREEREKFNDRDKESGRERGGRKCQ
jgi:hypothetical protein